MVINYHVSEVFFFLFHLSLSYRSVKVPVLRVSSPLHAYLLVFLSSFCGVMPLLHTRPTNQLKVNHVYENLLPHLRKTIKREQVYSTLLAGFFFFFFRSFSFRSEILLAEWCYMSEEGV